MTEDEAIDMAISEGDFDPSSPPGTRNSAMLKGFNRAAGIYRNATKLATRPR